MPKCAIVDTGDWKIMQNNSGKRLKMRNYVLSCPSMVMIGSKSANILKVCFFFYLGRTHKQIKEHYLNYLRPEINKDKWTLEEDLKLV
jgi:hypothetical protein